MSGHPAAPTPTLTGPRVPPRLTRLLPAISNRRRRTGHRADVNQTPGPRSVAPDVTPFVVTWFRFRHSRGGRRACSCWICGSDRGTTDR